MGFRPRRRDRRAPACRLTGCDQSTPRRELAASQDHDTFLYSSVQIDARGEKPDDADAAAGNTASVGEAGVAKS